MISKVISGGQTGADQAGLRAAKKQGIPTGGYMPWGFLTEEGYCPQLAEEFGMVAINAHTYPPRTYANLTELCDYLVWFGDVKTPGGKLTIKIARQLDKPYIIIPNSTSVTPSDFLIQFEDREIQSMSTLMVAGNRESTHPGIGKWVEEFLYNVFTCMKVCDG